VDSKGKRAEVGKDCKPLLGFNVEEFQFELSDSYSDIMTLQRAEERPDLLAMLRNSQNYPIELHF